MIGLVGTLIGVLLGLFLAFNIDWLVPAIERVFGFHILAKEVYYISELPSTSIGRRPTSPSSAGGLRSSRRFPTELAGPARESRGARCASPVPTSPFRRGLKKSYGLGDVAPCRCSTASISR